MSLRLSPEATSRVRLALRLAPFATPFQVVAPGLGPAFTPPAVLAVELTSVHLANLTSNLVASHPAHVEPVPLMAEPATIGVTDGLPWDDPVGLAGLVVGTAAPAAGTPDERGAASLSFELLRPLLQPPPGADFDDALRLPAHKRLKPFQRAGVRFLTGQPVALLADELGMAKTIQAIVAARDLYRLGAVQRGLVICPPTVLVDWQRKLSEWAPELRLAVIRGARPQRSAAWSAPAHLYLVAYDSVPEDIDDLRDRRFDLILLDEIQRITQTPAATAQAVYRLSAGIRWGLSGASLEGEIAGLCAVFAFLQPGLLLPGDAAYPRRVKAAVRPFVLQRRLADVRPEYELGEKIGDVTWLELTPAQRAAYDQFYQQCLHELRRRRAAITLNHVLAWIAQLKQICNLDPKSGSSAKLDYLLDVLGHDLAPDDQVLIFSQYPAKTLPYLHRALSAFKPESFSGSLSETGRRKLIQDFEQSDRRVLLLPGKTGGVGLTTTRASHVFHLDLWWNPAVAEQAENHAYRTGHEKPVFITTLYTTGTIEADIHALLERKSAALAPASEDLSDAGLSPLLTERELFGLFGHLGAEQASPP
jgi:SNF2 family DNA or RNA helicase